MYVYCVHQRSKFELHIVQKVKKNHEIVPFDTIILLSRIFLCGKILYTELATTSKSLNIFSNIRMIRRIIELLDFKQTSYHGATKSSIFLSQRTDYVIDSLPLTKFREKFMYGKYPRHNFPPEKNYKPLSKIFSSYVKRILFSAKNFISVSKASDLNYIIT